MKADSISQGPFSGEGKICSEQSEKFRLRGVSHALALSHRFGAAGDEPIK